MEITISLILKGVYFLFIFYVSTSILKWLFKYGKTLIIFKRVKCLPWLPFIGNLHHLKPRDQFFYQFYEVSREFKDEPFFAMWIGWTPSLIFHKVDYVEFLFSGSKNTQKSVQYDFLHPWLGEGLLTSYGEKWASRRQLLTPTFHFEILNDFLFVMNEQAEILVEKLENLAQKQEEIDIFRNIALCALDIICETAMGQNINAQMNSDSEYVAAVSKITEIIRLRMFQPYNWIDAVFNLTEAGREHKRCLNVLKNLTRRVIMERSAEFEETNLATQKRIAFLDMLLKAKYEDNSITFDDIQEEVDTFMFEGHDTTTVAASWACQLIGSHPDVQKKLHQEIDNLFGSSNRPIVNDDFKNLKYLECVIKETLRLFPSVPFFGRVTSVDETIGGHKIPKGSTAVILTYMIHRDEKHYVQPEEFDPDRFLAENSKDRHPYAFIPFSAGKRNCIGQRFAMMEEKIMLANILRKFEIQSVKSIKELCPVADIILKPINQLPVKLIPRNKN